MVPGRQLPQKIVSWSSAHTWSCLSLQFCVTRPFLKSIAHYYVWKILCKPGGLKGPLNTFTVRISFRIIGLVPTDTHYKVGLVTICYSSQTCSKPLLTARIVVRTYIFLLYRQHSLKHIQNCWVSIEVIHLSRNLRAFRGFFFLSVFACDSNSFYMLKVIPLVISLLNHIQMNKDRSITYFFS